MTPAAPAPLFAAAPAAAWPLAVESTASLQEASKPDLTVVACAVCAGKGVLEQRSGGGCCLFELVAVLKEWMALRRWGCEAVEARTHCG